jgi:hypothetical protein
MKSSEAYNINGNGPLPKIRATTYRLDYSCYGLGYSTLLSAWFRYPEIFSRAVSTINPGNPGIRPSGSTLWSMDHSPLGIWVLDLSFIDSIISH